MGIYSSSIGWLLLSLGLIVVIEIAMLIYSFINTPLYGGYEWRYRFFYISLLCLALLSMLLVILVRKNVEDRYIWLNIANPIFAVLFFTWALLLTASDVSITGNIDITTFMTFSLSVPLIFFMPPVMYAVIVLIADVLMVIITASVVDSVGPLINLVIFFIFQSVLVFGYLQLKKKLGERIVEESNNAERDILTGFYNRRSYNADTKKLTPETMADDFVYVAMDINGLKETNDSRGHDYGDKLIVGASTCMVLSFGNKGKLYRMGGDEFVMLLNISKEELKEKLEEFDKNMVTWSENYGLNLRVSYGHVSHEEEPGADITALAKIADQRMYVAKARYYEETGASRRHIQV